MTPNQIRRLFLSPEQKIKQADVARFADVTRTTVADVIARRTVSGKVQALIALALLKPLEEVFPERFRPIADTNALLF